MGGKMAFDVFLCHNSSDKEAVKKIGRKLQEAGLAPWLDAWHLEAGQRWRGELESQLGSIHCAAVFIGRDGMGPWQDLEAAAPPGFGRRGCLRRGC